MLIIILLLLLIILSTVSSLLDLEKLEKFIINDKDYFEDMDIYFINLKSRTLKRSQMESQLKRHNIIANAFDAVDGKKLNRNDLNMKNIISDNLSRVEMNGRTLRKGEIGCSLSHITIWKKFLSSKKKYLMIFEDDAILEDNFKENLNSILSNLDNINYKWDALYLNENCYRHFKSNCNGNFITNNVIKPKNVGYGCYGYILKKNFINKCLSDLFPIVIPVDNFIIKKSQLDPSLIVLRTENPLVNYDKNYISDTIYIK